MNSISSRNVTFADTTPQTACHVVVPCAGSGTRAGGEGPKQYQHLAGEPMVLHTLRAFAQTPGIAQVVVVVAPEDSQMQPLLTQHADEWHGLSIQAPRIGGSSRAASVLAGLQYLRAQGAPDTGWVMVHDAARCLITPSLITALMQACRVDDVGGLLAVPLADTLKAAVDQRATQTIERTDKWQAQTPQMFRLGLLIQALQAAQSCDFAGITDEASALEQLGYTTRLVPADAHNFKVTFPQDFVLAEALLKLRQQG